MNSNVVKFFKRNPDAPACHLVLTSCFKTAKAASSYRKNINAKRVTVTLRSEYEEWMAANAVPAAEAPAQSADKEVEERSKDQED